MTTQATQDVIAERQRQKDAEGWTPEHDDEHTGGELASAAGCYAMAAAKMVKNDPGSADYSAPTEWPWHPNWWKPSDPRRNLVKAAALILAEIERIDRSAHPKEGT